MFLALEMPSIACRVGAVPELISSKNEGILVEPRDPSQLANAIREVLSNEELHKTIGKNAREKIISKFGWNYVINKVEQLYNIILRDKK